MLPIGKVHACAALVLVLVMPVIARAELAFFTNEDDWRAAILAIDEGAIFSGEDFGAAEVDGATLGVGPHSYGEGDFEVTLNGIGNGGSSSGVINPGDHDGSNAFQARLVLDSSDFELFPGFVLQGEGMSSMDFEFGVAVLAFGAEWHSTNTHDSILINVNGEVAEFADHLPNHNLNDGDGFFGFVDVEGISSFKLSPSDNHLSAEFEEFEMDAVQLATIFSECGNGIVEFGENCDDGNLGANDGCSPKCLVEPRCLCDGAPSLCACTPLIPSHPHEIRKNRFLSIDPGNGPLLVALRVELLDRTCSGTGQRCTLASDCKVCNGGENDSLGCFFGADCPDGTCDSTTETCNEQSPPVPLGWLSDPVQAGGDALPGTFLSEVVSTQPAFRTWVEAVVHIGDCEIAPVKTYGISATSDGITFSDSLIVGTIERPLDKHWGDVVGKFDGTEWSPPNGLLGVDDVSAILKFLTLKPAPHITVLDLVGPSPTFLNMDVNASDLQQILIAFKGGLFPPIPLLVDGYPANGDVTLCP